MENYYKALGIHQTASTQQIKQAYKTLLTQYDSNRAVKKQQDREYYNLTIAYNTLIDKTKRNEYDRILNSILTLPELQKTHSAPKQDDAARPKKESHKKISYLAFLSLILLVLLAVVYARFIIDQKPEVSPPETLSTSKEVKPSVQTFKNNSEQNVLKNKTTANNKVIATNIKQDAEVTVPPAIHRQIQKTKQLLQLQKETTLKQEKVTTSVLKHPATDIQNNLLATTHQDIGATRTEILKKFGTPSTIVRYGNNNEVWSYANNTVHFSNGRAILLSGNAAEQIATPATYNN